MYVIPQSDNATRLAALDDDDVPTIYPIEPQTRSRNVTNTTDGLRRGSRGQVLPSGTPRTGSANGSLIAQGDR